ncbi:ABC transporter permease subunit [Caballeronia sp. J97]|uniref:amino acid ABC transporter permease n=1 Tax=Caballeronia sp. J97 TaxID=2805429 RepID=UPI002AB089D8|nr:ABC transporter permease subunit [Caballeronia sp. J97]
MFKDFDFPVILGSLRYLFIDGMSLTLTITTTATIGGILLGILLAMLRLSGGRVVPRIAAAYVNLFRALPLILVIFLLFFLMPYVGQWITGDSRPVQVGAYKSALVTFTLFEAAYFAEIIRSGIQSIPRGQISAASALGLNYIQLMGYVVLPQALRKMAPLLLMQTIILFQDTSLVYVLSLTDFLGAAAKVATRSGRLIEMYIFAAAVYFVICFAASRLVAVLQIRMSAAN